MKYPLTEDAQRAARKIVDDWRAKKLEQVFQVLDSGDTLWVFQNENLPNWESPPIGSLRELSRYGMISMRIDLEDNNQTRWEVLLLQELLNAVQNDFEVSEYFLTTSTVGTIINLGKGASVSGIQSIAINYGTAIQTEAHLADHLTETLGESLLESNAEIKAAIDELRRADDSNKTSRIGKVIELLGRSMGHVSNAVGIITGIQMIAQFLH